MEDWSGFGDVPLVIDAELGRLRMTVREILALEVGSLVELPRAAEENIAIRVGGTLIGFGEIVLMENSAAVRITDFTAAE